ncbi:cysteine-rich CWC family protein [Paludibacterium yongneupense]|uniref:cysteine-rich CWC family protein n=1 Tax=Paludibacterium yongneupense TaxID=400061 RepID=UPI000A04D100|nr:cysteine-rich CWC family protein [Paludibacterium yongneupense]
MSTASPSNATPARSMTCRQCGAPFRCGEGGKNGACWCADLPAVAMPLPGGDCVCPACLAAQLAKSVPCGK